MNLTRKIDGVIFKKIELISAALARSHLELEICVHENKCI